MVTYQVLSTLESRVLVTQGNLDLQKLLSRYL